MINRLLSLFSYSSNLNLLGCSQSILCQFDCSNPGFFEIDVLAMVSLAPEMWYSQLRRDLDC
jgi:hypothetical protein